MTVKVFRNTDYGAPANTNAAGALIAILDACLVNGYGSQNVTITRDGTTATVTTPAAHALKDGTFMRISGAMQSEYNGDFQITVTGTNTFTYPVSNSPVSPATGAITSKVSPAGWTKPFTGTNVAAFKQGAGSNGMYLRVADTTTGFPTAKAFENMSSIDFGTGQFPTDAQGAKIILKSSSATAQEWIIVANEKLVFIMTRCDGNSIYPVAFGDFISKKSGDTFNTIFSSPSSQSDNTPVSCTNAITSTGNGIYVARNNTQIGSSINVSLYSLNSGYLGSSGFNYPSQIDSALHLSPIKIVESAGFRGDLPGLWNPLHNKPFQHLDMITGTGDFAGKTFLAFIGGWANQAQWLIEISNTW